MTYLNKGQFYPVTLKEVSSSEGIHHPISKVRVSPAARPAVGELGRAASPPGGGPPERGPPGKGETPAGFPAAPAPASSRHSAAPSLAECRHGGFCRGQKPRGPVAALEVLALAAAHGQTKVH